MRVSQSVSELQTQTVELTLGELKMLTDGGTDDRWKIQSRYPTMPEEGKNALYLNQVLREYHISLITE